MRALIAAGIIMLALASAQAGEVKVRKAIGGDTKEAVFKNQSLKDAREHLQSEKARLQIVENGVSNVLVQIDGVDQTVFTGAQRTEFNDLKKATDDLAKAVEDLRKAVNDNRRAGRVTLNVLETMYGQATTAD